MSQTDWKSLHPSDSAKVVQAREAVTRLRDFARNCGMSHFERDPLVSAIHEALDEKAVDASPDLLASCKELRDALAGAMRVIYMADHVNEFVNEMRALGIKDGIGVRADAAIAKATK